MRLAVSRLVLLADARPAGLFVHSGFLRFTPNRLDDSASSRLQITQGFTHHFSNCLANKQLGCSVTGTVASKSSWANNIPNIYHNLAPTSKSLADLMCNDVLADCASPH